MHSVVKVGHVDKEEARVVRIVHISDTHLHHDEHLSSIPEGDILIHSGDFCQVKWKNLVKSPNLAQHRQLINDFFRKLPHGKKILVGGNHDKALDLGSQTRSQAYLAPNVLYLEDSGTEALGLNIYGAPWTAQKWTSYASAFAHKWGRFEHHWDKIPGGTDILVTHMPPQGIMDLARIKFPLISGNNNGTCDVCQIAHPGYVHWGCPALLRHVQERVKPKLHLFGHCHGNAGTVAKGETLYSNAALTTRVIDVYL